jgi:hypothetical protein
MQRIVLLLLHYNYTCFLSFEEENNEIAIPAKACGGLDAEKSRHFCQCGVSTVAGHLPHEMTIQTYEPL